MLFGRFYFWYSYWRAEARRQGLASAR